MHIKSTLKRFFICPLLKKGDNWSLLPSRFYFYLEFSVVSTLNPNLSLKERVWLGQSLEEVGFLRQPIGGGPEPPPRVASLRLSGATGTFELHG